MSKFKLFDLTKRGTVILAGPRYGSHYLANVIMHALPQECRPLRWPDSHSELGITDRGYLDVEQELEAMLAEPGYQIAIANDQSAKVLMLARPDLFDDWHIVRIIHNDKVRWFRSFWYFITADKQEFLHSGTDQTVYESHQTQTGPYQCSVQQINSIFGGITHTVLNQYIAVDEHIEYEDLATISTDDPWRANQYPDIALSEMFVNGQDFEALFESWPQEKFSEIRQPQPSRWTVTVDQDPDTGDLILPLPDDMLNQVGWKTDDVLKWIDNKDGTWTLQKKEPSANGDS